MENQGAEENKAALEEVLEIREENIRLQTEIAGKIKNEKDSRFMTFQPQDKVKHQELIQQSPGELQTLKDRYAQLATENTSSQFKLTEDEMAYVESLREENRQLTEQAEEMLRQKETSNLTRLRQRLSDN